jgi:hypothetical protein
MRAISFSDAVPAELRRVLSMSAGAAACHGIRTIALHAALASLPELSENGS